MPRSNQTNVSASPETKNSVVSGECGRSVPSVLVVGLGNILLSDEGAGIKVIENLKARFAIPDTIEVIDGGTMGMELLPYFDGKSHVIIIDAVNTGNSPGSVVRIDNLPAFFQSRISPHQIGLIDVLALASLSEESSPNVVLFGIEPATVDTGLDMSLDIQNKLDFLLATVVEELRTIGIDLQLISET